MFRPGKTTSTTKSKVDVENNFRIKYSDTVMVFNRKKKTPYHSSWRMGDAGTYYKVLMFYYGSRPAIQNDVPNNTAVTVQRFYQAVTVTAEVLLISLC